MVEVERLLQQKEIALRRVKSELDALRLAAALLAEPDQRMRSAPPEKRAPVDPHSAAEARLSDSPIPDRTSWRASRVPPAAARRQVFPEARDGVIVCDACGHQNPHHLVDCERCDIPIRLRS
ncbi:MAG: hypothetical protein JO041_05940 [Acidobacteria bacterium]|nr:hypothetical protein [Acidobacteriota bacterium]